MSYLTFQLLLFTARSFLMEAPETAHVDPLLTVGAVVVLLIFVRLVLWLLLRGGAVLVRRGAPYLGQVEAGWRRRRIRERLKTGFPRGYHWLARRLDPRRFNGLPLTLIAVAAIYLAFLFAGLIEEVMESEELEAAERMIVEAIEPFRAPALVTLFAWITELGDTATLTAVAIVATGFLWARGPNYLIGPVWLTVVGSQLTTWSGKFLIGRSRPDFVLEITAISPSFPSGHTTGAVAVYGVIAYVLARDLPTARLRFELAYWTAVLVLMVSFSRIFISVHHPADVAAGLLVGVFWLFAGIAFAEILRRRDAAATPDATPGAPPQG